MEGQKITIEVEDALDFLEAVGFSDDRVGIICFSSIIHFRISGEIYVGDMLSAGICCIGSSWIRLCSLMRMDLCFPGVAL